MSVRDQAVQAMRQTFLTRRVLAVIAMTGVLTAAFVGVLGLMSGAQLDIASRLPAYVLVLGVVFVATILRLDTPDRDGAKVLVATASIALIVFVAVGLATEGVVYAIQKPNTVITSQLVLYFAAAAMVCTGVVVWSLHHWREFARNNSSATGGNGGAL
jgi:Co/Zn/Cd efflux system component